MDKNQIIDFLDFNLQSYEGCHYVKIFGFNFVNNINDLLSDDVVFLRLSNKFDFLSENLSPSPEMEVAIIDALSAENFFEKNNW